MKKLITLATILIAFIGHAQNPLLLEYTWYVQTVHFNNLDYKLPGTFFSGELDTNETDFILSHPYCKEGFQTNVQYQSDDQFTNEDGGVVLLGVCGQPEIIEFMNAHYNVYLLDNYFAKNPFSYTIESDSMGLQLTVTNVDGDYAIYGNYSLDISEHIFNTTILAPNPFIDKLIIYPKEQLKLIKIYDLTGKVLIETKVLDGLQIELALDILSRGFYLVELISDNRKETKRIIKI
jgi:hypothetical protein